LHNRNNINITDNTNNINNMHWRYLITPESVGGANNGSIKIYRIMANDDYYSINPVDPGQWQVGYIVDPTDTTEITNWVTVADNWAGHTFGGLVDTPTGSPSPRGYRIGIRPLGSSGQGQWINGLQLNFHEGSSPGTRLVGSLGPYAEGEHGPYGASPESNNTNWYTNVTPAEFRCVQSGGVNTGQKEQKQFQNNMDIDTYGQIRWNNVGEDLDYCPLPADPTPNWQDTGNFRCVQVNGENTGEQEKEQQDINEASPTYQDLRWISNGQNTTACPIPVPPQEVNTGYKAWATLEEYFVDNGQRTGNEKPNLVNDPNYVPPVYDPQTCPLP
jgi:hypothetical protein